MEIFDLGDIHDLTKYSRVRVFLSGLWQVFFAIVVGAIPALLFWPHSKGEGAAGTAPHTQPSWEIATGIILAFIALAILAGGIGRIVSAFASDCYFRAGRDGFALRLPKQGWFGRFNLITYRFKWTEIDQIVNSVRRVNLIPISTSLHIHPKGGKKIEVPRIYFEKNPRELQKDLVTLQSESWRDAVPPR